MVYAGGAAEGTHDSTGSPPLATNALDEPQHEMSVSVEALRHAVEIQETHVRLLRARKVARERLLLRIQSLLATGDSLEAHRSVEHVVRQAEESLQQLVETEAAVVEGSPAEESKVDPVARIFHSGVEAQLAAARAEGQASSTSPSGASQDISPTTVDDIEALFDGLLRTQRTKQTKAHRKKKQKQPRAAAQHADPASLSDETEATQLDAQTPLPAPPHSAATAAFLAQSAARREAAESAMLAALEALQLSLKDSSTQETTKNTVDSGVGTSVDVHVERCGAAQMQQPSWLRDDVETAGPAETPASSTVNKRVGSISSRSSSRVDDDTRRGRLVQSASEEYSDDFEDASETEESDAEKEAEELPAQDESETATH